MSPPGVVATRPSAAHTPLSAAPHTHPCSTLPPQLCSPSGSAAQASADARTSTHATLQVRLHRLGRPAPTPASSLYWCRYVVSAGSSGLTSQHFSAGPSAAVAAWPSSAPCCRSTPAPAQLLLGGGASRWRPGPWSLYAASPLRRTHASLALAGFLFLSQTTARGPCLHLVCAESPQVAPAVGRTCKVVPGALWPARARNVRHEPLGMCADDHSGRPAPSWAAHRLIPQLPTHQRQLSLHTQQDNYHAAVQQQRPGGGSLVLGCQMGPRFRRRRAAFCAAAPGQNRPGPATLSSLRTDRTTCGPRRAFRLLLTCSPQLSPESRPGRPLSNRCPHQLPAAAPTPPSSLVA